MADALPWYEYFFIGVVLLISLLIGVVFACIGGKQKTTKEYLNADHGLRVIPVTLSLYMSFTSGISLLGNVAEVYTHGVQGWFASLGNGLSFSLAAIITIPMYHKLKVTSAFEYLKGRFRSEGVRKTASAFSIIGGILYMGSAMYAPATALEAITPIPLWGGLLLMGGIATLYTSVGGLKAVVWTDAFQGVIMFAGVLAIAILGMKNSGGIDNAWDSLKDNGRVWAKFSADPVVRISFWSALLGNIAVNTAPGPAVVQRVCAMPSLTKAQLAMFLTVPLQIGFYTVTYITGAAVFDHYTRAGCDPLRSGIISNPSQLLPEFVLNVLNKPALPGLLLSILIVGAISSVTSSMNTNAAVTWKDFMEDQPPFKSFPEYKKTITVKVMSFVYGCLGIGMSFAYRYFPAHVLQVAQSINLSVASPIRGMFFLGAFFPCANYIGAIVGAVCGFGLNFALGLGSSIVNPYALTLPTVVSSCPANLTINDAMLVEKDSSVFFKFAYLWYPTMGTAACIVIGLLVSLVTGPEKASDADPKYIIPLFDMLFCCLPESCRKVFWCGVQHNKSDFTSLDQENDMPSEKDGSPFGGVPGKKPTEADISDTGYIVGESTWL